MGKLDKMLAKPKKYTIAGEEFELSPLTLEDIDLLLQMEKPDKRADAINKIVKKTLSKAGEQETDIDSISIEYFEELLQAILDVNGLTEDKKKSKLGITSKDT